MRAPLLILCLLPTLCFAQPRSPQTPAELKLADQARAMYPGQSVKVEIVEESATAQAQGVSGTATGDKASLEGQNMTPPTVSLPGATGAGGGGGMTATATTLSKPSTVRIICGVLAVACLIGAGASVALKWRIPTTPIKLACHAISFGVCAWFPGIAIAVFAFTTALDLIDTLLGSHLSTRATEALRAVVAGVADVPEEIGKAVRDSVKAHADPKDAATIAAVKYRDGLK